jgi:hypothetical protein
MIQEPFFGPIRRSTPAEAENMGSRLRTSRAVNYQSNRSVTLLLKVFVKCRLVSAHITSYQNWHAIVIRRQPEVILVIDPSLTRAWTTVRLTFQEDLAFRTLSAKKFDSI